MIKTCVICGKQEDMKKGQVCYECVLRKNRERARSTEAKQKRKLYDKRPEVIARKKDLLNDPERKKRLYESKTRYNRTDKGKIKNRERQIRLHASWKNACFHAYGGPECKWCGDRYYNALSIDHIDNDGAEHRKLMRKRNRSVDGHSLYLWLRRKNFPPGFQVLCRTCNWAKHVNGGVLPPELKDRFRNKPLEGYSRFYPEE